MWKLKHHIRNSYKEWTLTYKALLQLLQRHLSKTGAAPHPFSFLQPPFTAQRDTYNRPTVALGGTVNLFKAPLAFAHFCHSGSTDHAAQRLVVAGFLGGGAGPAVGVVAERRHRKAPGATNAPHQFKAHGCQSLGQTKFRGHKLDENDVTGGLTNKKLRLSETPDERNERVAGEVLPPSGGSSPDRPCVWGSIRTHSRMVLRSATCGVFSL